jgi:hypothetical protein
MSTASQGVLKVACPDRTLKRFLCQVGELPASPAELLRQMSSPLYKQAQADRWHRIRDSYKVRSFFFGPAISSLFSADDRLRGRHFTGAGRLSLGDTTITVFAGNTLFF